MDEIGSVIRELFGTREMTEEERTNRVKLIGLLFRLFKDGDAARAELYFEATAEIPLDKLLAALASLLQTRQYSTVPTVADIYIAARVAAGMDREPYMAGRYLPPPRDWPPPGKRYAIHAGELEAMPKSATRLPAGSLAQLGAGEP